MDSALRIELPADVLNALEASGYTPRQLGEEAVRQLAGALYARSVLTLEQSARLAGMSVWDFIPFLGERGIAVAGYDDAQTAAELETAQWMTDPRTR